MMRCLYQSFSLKRYILILSACFVLMLQGCSTMQQTEASRVKLTSEQIQQAWLKHKLIMKSVKQWHINGRAGIRTSQRSGSVNFQWQQNNPAYELTFSGPFGELLAQLSGHTNGLSHLLMPGKPSITDQSGELLVWRATGWHIPFNALQYWVLGIPAPDARTGHKITLNSQGQLAQLQQFGWQIVYTKYVILNNYILPSHISITRPDIAVRLVIIWKKITS